MVTLYNGDCLVEMAKIPDKSVDMILCDLPYGTTACKWDSVIPIDALFAQYRRILKPKSAIVLTATQPFTSNLIVSQTAYYRHNWVWVKNKITGFANAKIQPLRCYEDIVVFGFESPRYYPQDTTHTNLILRNGKSVGGESLRGSIEDSANKGKLRTGGGIHIQDTTNYPRQVLCFDCEANTVHPTQKPVNLCRYLIRSYTNEGDLVLDNTMGSGTTGVACVKEKRNFIGIELNEEYFKIAQERIHNEESQLTLF